ncbi:MAG TPA: aminomethyltransferase family protein, partial [Candidatus Limnocylindrales bacterium]|nr:aminomethyltransferase family protein [Candidatus Limnocylindrales bacterium]
LNRKLQWREWAGYFASSAYADAHDIEYNAIREAAALIDVSPLYKYRVTGRDALALVDRVITRDASKLDVGSVFYTPWCDEHGKVIDDGTVHRVAEREVFWTAADPQLRWLTLNARGLEVEVEDVTEAVAAVALQGPLARAVLEDATGQPFDEVRYFRRRASALRLGRGRKPIPVEVSRTGYTGDLGYEVWIPAERAAEAWDALTAAGRAYGIRPAGMLALDVVRLEAGLVLLEVDYTSARHALNPEQNYSPYELAMGRLVDLEKRSDFVGRLALQREQADGGPARRLVGVQLDWHGIESAFSRQGLPPAISASVDRSAVPIFAPRGDRQIGKVTSHGWSPILKQAIGLAFVPPAYEKPGTPLAVEWTVEGHRGRVDATVVPLPFLDLPRKRA